MPQIRAEYEKIEEFATVAGKLIIKYPEILDGIDPKDIVCFGVTNKDPKEGKPLFEIRTVPYPVRLDVSYSYYVIVNAQDWASYSPNHQALLTMDVLCSLSREGDGKVVPFDLKDHAVMLRTVGVDYMKRGDVPDIINDQIDWKKD